MPDTYEANASTQVIVLGFNPSAFSLRSGDDHVTVETVTDNSWAERSGIKVGDEIVSVNGVKMSSMTKTGFAQALKKRPLALVLKRPESSSSDASSASEDSSSDSDSGDESKNLSNADSSKRSDATSRNSSAPNRSSKDSSQSRRVSQSRSGKRSDSSVSRSSSRRDSRRDSQRDSGSDSRRDSRSDSRKGSQRDSRSDSRRDSRSDSRGDSRIDSRSDSRRDSRKSSRSDSRRDSRSDSPRDSRSDSRRDSRDSRSDSRRDSRTDSRRGSRRGSTSQSRAGSSGTARSDGRDATEVPGSPDEVAREDSGGQEESDNDGKERNKADEAETERREAELAEQQAQQAEEERRAAGEAQTEQFLQQFRESLDAEISGIVKAVQETQEKSADKDKSADKANDKHVVAEAQSEVGCQELDANAAAAKELAEKSVFENKDPRLRKTADEEFESLQLLSMQKALEARRKEVAAVQIQSKTRGWQVRKELSAQKKVQEKKERRQQALKKRQDLLIAERRKVEEEKRKLWLEEDSLAKRNAAIKRVQAWIRGYITRKTVRQHTGAARAALIAERDARAAAFRERKEKEAFDYKLRKAEIAKQRREVDKKRAEAEKAVTRIQASWRAKLARRGVNQHLALVKAQEKQRQLRREREEAQRIYELKRRKDAERSRLEHAAATRIQSSFRGLLTRQQVELRLQADADRKRQEQELDAKHELKLKGKQDRENAVITVQANFRGWLTRRSLQDRWLGGDADESQPWLPERKTPQGNAPSPARTLAEDRSHISGAGSCGGGAERHAPIPFRSRAEEVSRFTPMQPWPDRSHISASGSCGGGKGQQRVAFGPGPLGSPAVPSAVNGSGPVGASRSPAPSLRNMHTSPSIALTGRGSPPSGQQSAMVGSGHPGAGAIGNSPRAAMGGSGPAGGSGRAPISTGGSAPPVSMFSGGRHGDLQRPVDLQAASRAMASSNGVSPVQTRKFATAREVAGSPRFVASSPSNGAGPSATPRPPNSSGPSAGPSGMLREGLVEKQANDVLGAAAARLRLDRARLQADIVSNLGNLDRNPHSGQSPQAREAAFDRVDANRDNVISRHELARAMQTGVLETSTAFSPPPRSGRPQASSSGLPPPSW